MSGRPREELVVEGARLAQADPLDRWAIGDLALEVTPPGDSRTSRATAQRELERFSHETGLSLGVLKDCYRTSAAWPLGRRVLDISHARHSKVAAKPNRVALLLGDEVSDGLSARVRTAVEKAEEILADAEVREAVIARSKGRSKRNATVARTLEQEEAQLARAEAKASEEHAKAALAADEIMSHMAERAIKGNNLLSKMIADVLEMRMVITQFPIDYQDRTAENLEQLARASRRALETLRPQTQSPQLRDVVVIAMDDYPEAEHR